MPRSRRGTRTRDARRVPTLNRHATAIAATPLHAACTVSTVSADPELEQGQALDLAAAELRADSVDIEALVAALAVRLEEALPGMVAVKRRRIGGFRSKESAIQAISLSLGDARFELQRSAGGFECTRHAVVRGITLKREQCVLTDWIADVVAAVAATAAVGEQSRVALEALIR
jgi:hypothetical protein